VALDDRYANKFAPLNSTAIYPKPDHVLLYTPMTDEMKCPRLYLCLAHFIPSPSMLMQHMHQPSPNDMIHFISSRDRIGSLILTSLALHHCLSPSAPSLAQASLSHAVSHFKASDLPFTLATVHQAKPHFDLRHLGHMTPCHVSYAMSSFMTQSPVD
jgi:hypothetical protein